MTHHTMDAKDHDGSMSHLGHLRRFDRVQLTSGLTPFSTELGCRRRVYPRSRPLRRTSRFGRFVSE